MHQRKQQGHKKRSQQVGEDNVGGDVSGIASQLACYHGGSRSRRTYHAEHGTFYQDACGEVGQEYKEQCHQRETPALYQQQPQVPAAGAQVVQANLTEGKKQHREYQQRLNDVDGTCHKRFGRGKRGNVYVDHIKQHSRCHCYRECPVLTKSNNVHGVNLGNKCVLRDWKRWSTPRKEWFQECLTTPLQAGRRQR